jgi:hypothetical protein
VRRFAVLDDDDDELDALPLFQPSAAIGLTGEIAGGMVDFLLCKTDRDMRRNRVERLFQNVLSALPKVGGFQASLAGSLTGLSRCGQPGRGPQSRTRIGVVGRLGGLSRGVSPAVGGSRWPQGPEPQAGGFFSAIRPLMPKSTLKSIAQHLTAREHIALFCAAADIDHTAAVILSRTCQLPRSRAPCG